MIVNSAVRLAYAPHPKIMVSLSLGSDSDDAMIMIKDFLDQDLLDPSLRTPHTIRLLTRRKAQRDCLTEGREGLLSQDLIILPTEGYHTIRRKKFEIFFSFGARSAAVV